VGVEESMRIFWKEKDTGTKGPRSHPIGHKGNKAGMGMVRFSRKGNWRASSYKTSLEKKNKKESSPCVTEELRRLSGQLEAEERKTPCEKSCDDIVESKIVSGGRDGYPRNNSWKLSPL